MSHTQKKHQQRPNGARAAFVGFEKLNKNEQLFYQMFPSIVQKASPSIYRDIICRLVKKATVSSFRMFICTLKEQNEDAPEHMKRILGETPYQLFLKL